VIDGARELLRALQGGIEVLEVYVCEELCRSEECRELLKALAEPTALQPEILYVTREVFEKLAFGARAEGVVGVARTPAHSLTNLVVLPKNPLVAVLEGVEKPGNVGAVLRSADAAGVSALVVADGGTDLYNPNAIRASLGTIFTVPVCAASSAAALAWLQERRLTIYAAWVDAEREYTEVDFTGPCAVVLGNEAEGLSDVWRPDRSGITAVKLPMLGVADSLNVSTAAAVLFYEALRQRGGT
jgi:TrmH family RNA methyltransferase